MNSFEFELLACNVDFTNIETWCRLPHEAIITTWRSSCSEMGHACDHWTICVSHRIGKPNNSQNREQQGHWYFGVCPVCKSGDSYESADICLSIFRQAEPGQPPNYWTIDCVSPSWKNLKISPHSDVEAVWLSSRPVQENPRKIQFWGLGAISIAN